MTGRAVELKEILRLHSTGLCSVFTKIFDVGDNIMVPHMLCAQSVEIRKSLQRHETEKR